MQQKLTNFDRNLPSFTTVNNKKTERKIAATGGRICVKNSRYFSLLLQLDRQPQLYLDMHGRTYERFQGLQYSSNTNNLALCKPKITGGQSWVQRLINLEILVRSLKLSNSMPYKESLCGTTVGAPIQFLQLESLNYYRFSWVQKYFIMLLSTCRNF